MAGLTGGTEQAELPKTKVVVNVRTKEESCK